ncbi:MAG: DUF1365 domain-containing protein [Verrucomicrobiaceae bacterium]
MTSALYECDVMHRRLKPKQKAFSYKVFMLSIDLDNFPRLPFLGHNRFSLFALNDRDHIDLGLPGGIRPNLAAWLAQQNVTLSPTSSVRLVTFPTVLGYGFNPVSFYYVTDENGEPEFAVAEVCNTFREMKLFLVDGKADAAWHKRIAKNFYVSPFSDPGDAFNFKLGIPGEHLRVNIDNIEDDGTSLITTVRGQRHPLTSARLLWFSLKYPLLSLKIITMIHWQALKLWLKKVRLFRKTDRPEAQTDVLRPHSSITRKP